MIIHFPGISSRRIKTPVSLIDLTPTVLDFMTVKTDQIRTDDNWMTFIKKNEKIQKRPVLSFAFKDSAISDKFSVIKWPYQVICNPSTNNMFEKEYYDLSLSPSFSKFDRISRTILVSSSNRSYRYFLHQIKGLKSIFGKKIPSTLQHNNNIEKLKALGYMN
jgi:hypothetical protein